MGLFGDLFDFNGDGELDVFEQTAEFCAFMELTKTDSDDDLSYDEDFDDYDNYDDSDDF